MADALTLMFLRPQIANTAPVNGYLILVNLKGPNDDWVTTVANYHGTTINSGGDIITSRGPNGWAVLDNQIWLIYDTFYISAIYLGPSPNVSDALLGLAAMASGVVLVQLVPEQVKNIIDWWNSLGVEGQAGFGVFSGS